MFGNEQQRAKLQQWHTSSHIVAYDGSTSHLTNASTLISVLKKFTNEGWEGQPMILRGGFSRFATEFPDWVEPTPHVPSLTAQQQLQGGFGLEEGGLRRGGVGDKESCSIGLTLPCSSFSASKPPLTDSYNAMHRNIRQNIELIDGGVGQLPVRLPAALASEDARRLSLPQWLQHASDIHDRGKAVSDKFLAIERTEQRRMQEALADGARYSAPPTDPSATAAAEKTCRIAGIEKGLKNRYSNVYPYDHSRVRLQGVPKDACDYVNASHVQASRSNKRYIATQAPLPSTFQV